MSDFSVGMNALYVYMYICVYANKRKDIDNCTHAGFNESSYILPFSTQMSPILLNNSAPRIDSLPL